jgi:hypothetical protein
MRPKLKAFYEHYYRRYAAKQLYWWK